MVNNRSFRVFFLLTLLVLCLPGTISAQSAGQKYTHPIAFVRADGIYMTDAAGSQPTRVISPVQVDNQAAHLFSRPRWSPDGQQIVASDCAYKDTGWSSTTLVRVTTQNKQQPFYTMERESSMSFVPTVWTPDSTGIAVFDNKTIFVLPAKGGEPKVLYTPKIIYSIGEAGDPIELSMNLVDEEYEINRLRTRFLLQGTAFGLLLGTDLQRSDGGVDTWGLVSFDGKLVWSDYFISTPVISPDGRQAVAMYGGFIEGYDMKQGNEPFVLIDLQTGKVSVLKIRPNGVLLGWSADSKSIYYGIGVTSEVVEGDSDAPLVKEIFGEHSLPFFARENTLTLWRISLDAPDMSKAVKVFQTKGGAFGVMTVSDASQPLVFSIIQSSVPMVKAINSGATRQAVETLRPQAVLHAIDPQTGALRWTMAGGRPAYGKASFIAVAP